jgi:hypothetical protein
MNIKGMNKDMTCRGTQYKEGEIAEVKGKPVICENGIHYVENPHDVFNYYSPGQSRYFEVEPLGEISRKQGENEDSKCCTNKLRIGAEVSVKTICQFSVKAFFERFKFKEKIESADTNNAGNYGAANAGNCGAANAGNYGAANAGYRGAANAGNCGAANAGNYGAANAGYRGAANAGDCGAANAGYRGAANAGDCGAANAGNCGAANAGYRGAANAGYRGAANAGDCGAANAGDCGAANAGYRGAANAGDCGAANAGDRGAANAGYRGAAIVQAEGSATVGEKGVAVCMGNNSKAKGGAGSVLILVERDEDYNITNAKTLIVGADGIKPDTWYKLVNGQVEEST